MLVNIMQPTQSDKPKGRRPLAYRSDSEIIRAEHAPLVTGLSSTTIWRRRKAGQFVPEIKLGENSIGFRRADIVAWLEQRSAR